MTTSTLSVVIVDINVWIDLLRGTDTPQTGWLEHNIEKEPVALTDLILCELLQGTDSESQFRSMQAYLSDFPVFDTGGQALATEAAKNYRRLRSRGFTIRKTIDCIIATFCIGEGHFLLHRDSDFEPFEKHLGLQVVHPQTSF